jgi:putative methionine-R-sulfoxide reductase with GAF domain
VLDVDSPFPAGFAPGEAALLEQLVAAVFDPRP